MTGFESRLIGAAKVLATLTEITARTEAADKLIVAAIGARVEKAAKANFEGSHARNEPHTGGDKPNVVTGSLRRSIHMDPITNSGDGWTSKVGPATVYARAIEWGNPHSHSAAYPYFTPAVDAVAPLAPGIAAALWAAATRP